MRESVYVPRVTNLLHGHDIIHSDVNALYISGVSYLYYILEFLSWCTSLITIY